MSEQPPLSGPPPPPPPPPATTPPPAPPAATAEGPSGPRAGFWHRLAAFLLDAIILAIAQGIVNSIFGVDFFGYQYGFFADARGAEGNAGASLLNTLIGIAYYTYFEGSPAGQTPAKRVLGIRVIDFRSGAPLGYPRAALRWLCRILSILPCGLGFFWMLWDKERQTWHDKLTNTVVVPTSAYPAEKWPG